MQIRCVHGTNKRKREREEKRKHTQCTHALAAQANRKLLFSIKLIKKRVVSCMTSIKWVRSRLFAVSFLECASFIFYVKNFLCLKQNTFFSVTQREKNCTFMWRKKTLCFFPTENTSNGLKFLSCFEALYLSTNFLVKHRKVEICSKHFINAKITVNFLKQYLKFYIHQPHFPLHNSCSDIWVFSFVQQKKKNNNNIVQHQTTFKLSSKSYDKMLATYPCFVNYCFHSVPSMHIIHDKNSLVYFCFDSSCKIWF